MKRTSFFLLCVLMLPVSTGLANPLPPVNFLVQSIALTYDLSKNALHVEAIHHSNNWQIDYIRMMTVSLNGQNVSTVNYDHQTSGTGLTDDVPVSAKAGDVISVTLFTSGGSSKTLDMTVTPSDTPQTVQSPDVSSIPVDNTGS